MEIKSGLCVKKNDVSDEGELRKTESLDNRMRISTITALARAIQNESSLKLEADQMMRTDKRYKPGD